MTDYGIDVEAVTTDGKTVTLYHISAFEHLGIGGKPCVSAFTIDRDRVCIDAAEAQRVRRTANKSSTE